MRLELLNVFLSVLESSSLAAAARLLHMAQPSVSMALASLEEELGQPLLVRSPGQRKPVTPTAAGQIFAKYARKALADYRIMNAALLAAADSPPGPVRIGATSSPGASVLPVLVNKFRMENEVVPVQVNTFRGSEIFRRLKEKHYDIAITGTHPQEEGLVFDRFFYDPLVLICPASFGITGPITLRELRALPLIIRDSSGNLMQLLIQALKRAGLNISDMNVVMQVYGNNDVLSAVALGSGAGFIARSLLVANRENKEIVEVPVKRFQVERYIYIVRRKSEPFIGGLRLFWEFAMGTSWRENVFSYNTLSL